MFELRSGQNMVSQLYCCETLIEKKLNLTT